jgi:hypothetical protein
MERTESLVARTGELQRGDLLHEVDDVGRVADLGNHRVVEVYEGHGSLRVDESTSLRVGTA